MAEETTAVAPPGALGSLGVALLNTIYTTAATAYFASHVVTDQAGKLGGLVHGYATAFAWGAGLLALSALVIATMLQVRKEDLASTPHGVPVD